jgi:hypothetical protein
MFIQKPVIKGDAMKALFYLKDKSGRHYSGWESGNPYWTFSMSRTIKFTKDAAENAIGFYDYLKGCTIQPIPENYRDLLIEIWNAFFWHTALWRWRWRKKCPVCDSYRILWQKNVIRKNTPGYGRLVSFSGECRRCEHPIYIVLF